MMAKRMILVAVALAVVFGALAATETVGDYAWTYRINGNTAEIYAGSSSPAISPSPIGSVTIPSTLGGKRVTSIGYYAFSGCSGLTSVTIPDSVTSIGDSAFYNCSGLASVTIPDGVTSIGSSAFYGCSGLTNVTIPNSVTSIGSSAFYGCSGLTSVTIPSSVTSIGYEAFSGCSGLTSVTIPDSVTSIGYSLFARCSSLTAFAVGSGHPSYMSVSGLLLTKDGKTLVAVPGGLASVTIPDSVTRIREYAFDSCSGLTSVTIPDSVTSIGGYAFYYCSGLTSVTIPDSVTSIGGGAFASCIGLEEMTLPFVGAQRGNTGSVDSLFGYIFDVSRAYTGDTETRQYYSSSSSRKFYIPSRLKKVVVTDETVLGYGAFSYCRGLTSVTIPDSVTSIGDSAFAGCEGLTSVTIPNSVTSIGAGAFSGCSGLTSMTIPNSVTSIGSYAFSGCYGIKSVTVPQYVLDMRIGDVFSSAITSVSYSSVITNIGSYAFSYCSGLTSVTIPDSVTSIGDRAFLHCSGLTNVTIGNSVTSIGGYAFYGCSGLTSVTIGNSVTSIGGYAFYECSGLTSVTIGNSVTSIGNSAFSDCSGLTSVTIPDNVTSIGSGAFDGCSGLTSVTIGNSVTSIGSYAFCGCRGLVSFAVGSVNANYKSVNGLLLSKDGNTLIAGINGDVTIPDSVTSIEGYAFYYCCGLTSVTIPDSVASIGDYAFYHCCGLTNVTIGTSVTSIGDNAFWSCSGLTSVTIPDSVTSIGSRAFASCSGLTSVYLSSDYAGSTDVFPNATPIIRYKPHQAVSLDANGGSVTPGLVNVNYGSQYGEIPDPVREGYAFIGWKRDAFDVDTSTVVTTLDDHTLIAQWQINQYTVTFDANGGMSVSPITQNYNTAITPPANPTRTGYTFNGWSPAVPSMMPANNTTCVAQWKANQYTQTFSANGGTGGKVVTQDCGTPLTAPTVKRTGYTFAGWSPVVPATVPAANATYTAQWTVNQYTVTFDANGGMGGKTVTQDYGTTIVVPIVARDGCTFDGWMPIPDSIVPAHDVTYVAQWKVWDVTVASASLKIKELYPDDYQRITNIVIDTSVASLPDNFFEGCDALEKVTFLSPDTELGNNDLRKVGKLFANQPNGYWIVQGVLLGYKGVCPRKIPNLDAVKRVFDGALEGCTALEELTFTAESVLTAIGTNAFKRCTELRQMTLPPSLTEIGDEAFMGCSYLGNVIVPGRVKRVGNRAFKNCTGFTAAQIEYGVESLGEEAFCGDWRISEVDIPSTVTNIGVNAFGGDSSIIRIGLRGDVRKAKDIFSNYKFIREATVKEGAGEIVDGLFSGFEKLRDVRFFGNCPQLENDGQLLYAMTPGKSDDNAGLTTYVEANSTGWDGTPGSHSLPQAWPLAGGSRRAIAYWDVPSYLCQFESNGGTLGVQDTYQYSEKPFLLPPEPVQSGYKFAGWWTKPVGGLHVTSDTIFIEGVYTMLYAHWIKGHWVFLDPNGGTVVNDYITYVEETTYGVLPSPVRSGYAFNGWLYNDIVIEPTTVISDKNDHTLVAQWTANLYSVRYHANGGIGNMDDESRTYGVEQALRKNIFVNEGYTFAGWATNETDEIIYSDCEVVSNMTAVANGWIDLYAVWEESDITPDPSNLNFYFSGDANWERCAEGVEVEKDGETVRFDSVWKSGFVTNNQTSVLAADVYGAGKIGFWWKVSCESFRNWKLDNLEFAIDGVPQEPWINGETDWQYLEFEVNETGAHTLTWTYSKDESDDGMDVGEDCGRITAAVWTPSLVTLGDYVNCPRLEFRSSGDAEWAGDLQVSHDGIASLRSGEISHNSTTKVELDVDGEGRIGFWWKVSSEAFRQLPIDYVSFKLDGIEQAWIGGEVDWTNVAFNVVGNGTRTLSWEYHKDSEGSAGEDCAWIDEIVWMPGGGTIPELSPAQAAAWVSNDLATRYAKSGESAADYKSRFEAKFGADPVAAMAMPTDKKDAQGNDMYVWQDYVAGTDPTDTNSVFTATITMVDGAPVVTWEPELSPEQSALRAYTIYGKTNLTDKAWHSPTNGASRFFKVGVELR